MVDPGVALLGVVANDKQAVGVEEGDAPGRARLVQAEQFPAGRYVVHPNALPRYCAPLPVLSITDPQGHSLPEAQPTCHPAVSADVARAAVDAARCPVGQQSAYGRCDGGTAPEVGTMFKNRPVAGKTGSTEDNATETFVATTPQLAAAGIAADPASRADAVGSGVSSSVNTAVANTLLTALAGQPERQFTPPPPGLAGQ